MTPPRHCPARGAGAALALAAIVAAGLVGSGTAFADPARSRAHFELGKRYFQVEEYRKAIEEFKAAHIEEPDPAYLYNIGECHRRLGEITEALTFYRRFLSLSPPNAPSRSIVARRVAELEGAPAAAAPPPSAVVSLAAPPPASPASAILDAPPALAEGAAEPVAASKPFYKRGWFFGVLGAVVIGGVIGVWALSSGGSDIPKTPLGNQPAF